MPRPAHLCAALVAGLAGLTASVAAQATAPEVLVLTGDLLPGGGRVTGIDLVHQSAYSTWFARVSTDLPSRPSVVLRDGLPWKAAGDPVSEPGGATLARVDGLSSELFGRVVSLARLDGTAGGGRDDEALYYEDILWAQKGEVLDTDLWFDVAAGTRLRSLDDVRASPLAGTVLIRGRHDDPTIAGPDETFLALGQMCPSGQLCSVDRVLVEDQVVTSPGIRLGSVNLEPAGAAVAPSGSGALWSGRLQDPAGPTVGCFGHISLSHAVTVLAVEGEPAPVAGRRWGPMDHLAVDINSSGTWTVRARLDDGDLSDDEVLVRNGSLLAREGDPAPGIPGAVYAGFGRGAALVDDVGNTVWYARVDGPGGPADVIYADGVPLVVSGTTTIGGRTLVALDAGTDTFSLRPQLGVLLFTGRLEGGVRGLFRLDVDG